MEGIGGRAAGSRSDGRRAHLIPTQTNSQPGSQLQSRLLLTSPQPSPRRPPPPPPPAGMSAPRKRPTDPDHHHQGRSRPKRPRPDHHPPLSLTSHVRLHWDGASRRVVPAEDQIGIPRSSLAPFLHTPPPRRRELADVLPVPEEVFALDNLRRVLSYEVRH